MVWSPADTGQQYGLYFDILKAVIFWVKTHTQTTLPQKKSNLEFQFVKHVSIQPTISILTRSETAPERFDKTINSIFNC